MSDTEPSAPADPTRALLTVTAGILPGRADPDYTRRWTIGAREFDDAMAQGVEVAGEVLADRNARAIGYAGYLMLQPDRLNWVRTDWIWL